MNFTGKSFAFLLLCHILLTGILFAEDPTIIPSGSMNGFVYVLDGLPELHPIPGALVELFGASETGEIITISPISSIQTEENGSYYFTDLVSAPYMVRLSKDGYQMRMEMVFILPDNTLRKDFFLVPSQTPTPNPPDTGVLKGVVSEDAGPLAIVPPPIPQAHVLVYKYSNLTQFDSSKSIFLREAYTDMTGFYQIPDLPYGSYTVIVEAKTFLPQNKTVNMDKPEALLDFSLIKLPEPTPPPPIYIITVGHSSDYDYQTIAQALDVAGPGYMILVAADEYSTNTGETFPLIMKPGVILKRMDETARPTIRGDGKNSVIKCSDIPENTHTLIEGFLIMGGGPSYDLGGGVRCENASLHILQCIITGNSALAGGGVFCLGGSPLFYGCIISDNFGRGYGGGVRCQGYARAKFVNCLFTGNTSSGKGGGAYCREGETSFLNCTFTRNSALAGGGLFCWLPETRAHVMNSIIRDNEGGNAEFQGEDCLLTIHYSCVDGGFSGEGNIDADPLFDDSGLYYLPSGSPCIDSGNNEKCPPTDLDGRIRPYDGNGNGDAVVDMGCYESGAPMPTPTPIPTPVPEALLHGRVIEDVGMLTIVPPPVPNALIQVFNYQYNIIGANTSDLILIAEAYADEEGYYEIPNLPYNIYYVKAGASGYYPRNAIVWIDKPDLELIFELRKNILPTPTSTPTPIPVGGIFGVVLGMDEGSSTTHPVSGAVVEAFSPFWDCMGKDKCIMPPVARAITDEKGFYIMGQVPAGSWEVVARAEGFLPESGLVDVIPDEETERNFLLSPGETPSEGEIFGYVHGGIPEGVLALIPFNTLSGAKIEVFNTPILDMAGIEPFPDPGEPITVTYADETGNYRIIGLATNRYYLIRASHEKYFTGYKTIIIYNEPLQVNFFLDPVPNPTPGGSVIRGRVFEQSSGDSMLNPLFGVLIIIQRIGENSSSGDLPAPTILYTDGEGKYVSDNLESGYYAIQTRTVGYYPQFRHVILGENEEKIVHFILTPIGTEPPPPPDSGNISGHVSALVPGQIDQETSPIAGALVSVYPMVSSASGWPDIQPLFGATTNAEGFYEIPGIPPGIYLVAAEAPGYERCIDKADVPPGDNMTLDFRLKPVIVPIPTPDPEPGNLAGQALGMESEGIFKPLPGAHILVFPAQIIHEENLPAPIRRCFTDEEGKFLFENLRAGDYLVMACAKGFEPGALPAAVLEGQTTHIAFKLLPAPQPSPTPAPYPGALDGHVAFEKEGIMMPIPSAQVLAVHMNYESSDMLGDLPVRHTATDEFGYYHFADLRTGSYLVTVKAQGFYPAQDHAKVFPQEVATLNFILKPEDQPTTETGAIIGKVMTADDSTSPALIPLKDADIIVLRVINTLEAGEILIPAGRAVTDEMGAYTVENLRTGIYTVIAQKAGYSRGVKKARVKPAAKTEVNFLLVPTGQSEPAVLQTDLYESRFNDNAENWQTGGAPGFFLEPEAECHEGALRLHCSNNQQTFGFWHSPSDAIPVKPGMIYKAIFALSSDIADPAKVPCIRIRFNSQSEQIADMVVINSKGDAALSPGPGGRIYDFYFTPPRQEYCLPESENDIYASFDLVNMDIGDAEEATISLDWIKIESLSRENLPAGSEAASLDFSVSSLGWTTQFAAGFFDPPLALCPPNAEGLVLKAANNTATFGTWVSPASLVQMKANTLYEVTWRIYSDQADSSTVPGIRIRAGDEFNRLIAQKCIFSNAEGDNSPTPAGDLYTIYYTATQEMDELGMYLAFDIVNMNPGDAPEGAIGLQNVSVKAIPLE